MNQRYELTPHETVTVLESTPEALVVEAEYAPGGSPPPRHFHPSQDEHFRVLEGTLRVTVDQHDRELRSGDEIDIARGAAHQMWNPGESPARVTWTTSPAGRTKAWYRELHALRASGRVGQDGMPGALAFAVMLTEYSDVFCLAGPQPLLRGAFAALAPLGRARGYRPRFAQPATQ